MVKKRKKKDYAKMRFVAFFLPKTEIDRIDRLAESGCPLENRSEVIRNCINEKLPELEEKYMKK